MSLITINDAELIFPNIYGTNKYDRYSTLFRYTGDDLKNLGLHETRDRPDCYTSNSKFAPIVSGCDETLANILKLLDLCKVRNLSPDTFFKNKKVTLILHKYEYCITKGYSVIEGSGLSLVEILLSFENSVEILLSFENSVEILNEAKSFDSQTITMTKGD